MTKYLNLHTEELFKDAYGSRRAEFYAGLLAEVIMHGKPGTLIDLGAGLGLFAELAHKWGVDVVGFEGSAYAVNEALKRVPGIKMQVHDLGDPLPLPDESASVVVINQVIEHIDMDRFCALLSECYRVLNQSGRLFIYSPSRRNLKEKLEKTHINMLLPSELKKILESSGFSVLRQPDHGFWFITANVPIVNLAAKILLRFFPHDWVSASANAIAKKV